MTKDNISADAIGASALEKKGPSGPVGLDPLSRDPVLDQHLGKIGLFIGGGPEKAGNIAYIVVIAAIVILVIGACGSAYVQSDKLAAVFGNLVTGCLSLITGALGFIFGKSGKD
jgi:hypothetical protein